MASLSRSPVSFKIRDLYLPQTHCTSKKSWITLSFPDLTAKPKTVTKMQAALSLSTPISITRSKNSLPWTTVKPRKNAILLRRRVTSSAESVTVDYSSATSVFPAEACDVVGGEACAAVVYPEVKPTSEMASSRRQNAIEEVDREYLEYSEPKTVFPDEACDDLGGEFCEAEYQKGVHR